jgi:hypothetical protein
MQIILMAQLVQQDIKAKIAHLLFVTRVCGCMDPSEFRREERSIVLVCINMDIA